MATVRRQTIRSYTKRTGFSLYAVLILACLFLASCTTSGRYNTQKGALAGAGAGAIAGQIIGRSTNATLIGAGTGALIGAIAGNAQDQANQEIRDREGGLPEPDYRQAAYAEEAPPGRWVTVPGRWEGNRWIPSHRQWVPVDPRRTDR